MGGGELNRRNFEPRLHQGSKSGEHHIALGGPHGKHVHIMGINKRTFQTLFGRRYRHVFVLKLGLLFSVDGVMAFLDAIAFEDAAFEVGFLAVNQA